jgi:DsbC/DsbD-like thiol-disulfide interchange protein
MDRRIFLAMLAQLTCVAGARAEQPWSSRFLDGGFADGFYWSGLAITMTQGWKTYWRMPGSGGIPPQLEGRGANLKAAELLFPVPLRFRDDGGESIGYKDEVVFPIRLEPKDLGVPLEVSFAAFFGICEVVCIPARSEASLRFAMGSNASADAKLLQQWLEKVPALSENGPVRSVTATMTAEKPTLAIELDSPVDEVFVSGAEKYYFHAPRIEGQRAMVLVSGASSADELKRQSLRFVTIAAGKALEQAITVE